MSTLPTSRTTTNTPAEHVADHNELHRVHNIWESHDPSEFLNPDSPVPFRLTKRIATITDGPIVTPDVDNYDGGYLASLSQNVTIQNPSGTPTEFQTYVLRIKSALARPFTFGGAYRGGADVTLPPTTTGTNLTDYLGFQWNAQSSTWDLIAKVTGY